jgi:uncharacterized protein
LSHIPEDKPLIERGLSLPLRELGLDSPWTGDDLKLSYEIQNIHGKILGTFEVEGSLSLDCSRCLDTFATTVKSRFLLEFEKLEENHNPRNAPDPEDAGLNVVVFSGDEIEFGDEIRQEMELLVPFAPLCREDCRGLCQACGARLNEVDCGCARPVKDNPFQALKSLFKDNKEN